MEFSEAFRAEDIAKTDFFDFVVTPEDMGTDIVLHNNFPPWSRKSLGLFANNNNNNHHHHHHLAGSDAAEASVNGDNLHPAKEANNNSILHNFADDAFWDTGGAKAAFAAANIKMEEPPTLEEINDICWSSNGPAEPPAPHRSEDDQGANQREEGDDNTDGSIYTLTVVNGQEPPPPAPPPPTAPPGAAPGGAAPQAPPLWYRPPDLSSILREGDEHLRQAMSSMDPGGQCGAADAHQYQTSLDIDSIISILPSLGAGLGSSLPEGLDHGLFNGPPDPGLHHQDDLLGAGGGVCDDSGFVESKEDGQLKQQPSSSAPQGVQDAAGDRQRPYSENNNDWAFSNHNESSESLLRSALQGGKAYLSQYNDTKTLTELGPPGMFMAAGDMLPALDAPGIGMFDDMYGNGGPASAASQCTSTCTSTTCMDDILLSPLDDYEKLKMIENEVAESAKRYGIHHYGAPPPATAPPASSHPSTPTTPARPKKKASRRSGERPPAKPKASSAAGAVSSSSASVTTNGARRERSLHHCTICSKAFKDKYSVNVHIRTHTGEKPFACSVCGKSFRQKAHLAKHYHTHIVQKSELPSNKGLSAKAR
ncbi:Ichor [Frankliniella fusca]|uniref:Ichor n=1 Tax=Frankliniella fusca TaxID=407009 RepID=A0AAE1H1V8_9NEOP|nr:Ichor [Frankliniella fusca]